MHFESSAITLILRAFDDGHNSPEPYLFVLHVTTFDDLAYLEGLRLPKDIQWTKTHRMTLQLHLKSLGFVRAGWFHYSKLKGNWRKQWHEVKL